MSDLDASLRAMHADPENPALRDRALAAMRRLNPGPHFVVFNAPLGNLEATQAVLGHIKARGYPNSFCLGQLVGLGPNPRETVDLIRRSGVECIAGYSERALSGHTGLMTSIHIHELLLWSRQALEDSAERPEPEAEEPAAESMVTESTADESVAAMPYYPPSSLDLESGLERPVSRLQWILDLPARRTRHECLFASSRALNRRFSYFRSERWAGLHHSSFKELVETIPRLTFLSSQGSLSEPAFIIDQDGEPLAFDPLGWVTLKPDRKYFIYPGSVGQLDPPEKASPKSCQGFGSYIEVIGQQLIWHRVSYDLKPTLRKLRREMSSVPDTSIEFVVSSLTNQRGWHGIPAERYLESAESLSH